MSSASIPLNSRALSVLLCFCLATAAFSVPANAGNARLRQRDKVLAAQSQSPANNNFKFGKVDLELLEQVDLLDKRLEREGLVLEDDATTVYLNRVGQSLLVPRGLTLENVSWRFRALRDSQPNAFALLNDSVYVSTGMMTLMDNE